MSISDTRKRLKDSGYSDKDIIELATIFLKQLAIFKIDIDKSELSEQLHKLKGGVRLLYFDTYLHEIEMLEDANNSDEVASFESEFISLLDSLKQDLRSLRDYSQL